MQSYTVYAAPGQGYPSFPIEDRATSPLDPGGGDGSRAAAAAGWYYLGQGERYAEERIDQHTALTYSAVWACVQVISQTIACLGWHVYDRGPRANRQLPLDDDVAWLLDMQASPEMSALDWRQTMLVDALTWGNGYAEIERTGSGRPLWLYRLAPGRVTLTRDRAGRLVYEVENEDRNVEAVLPPENVFHLKGMGDGLVGLSVIEMARRTIKLGLQEERFGSDFFGRGVMPGGIVTLPGQVPKTKRDEFRRSFEDVYAGARGQHRVVVLSDGVTFTQADLPNEDAQFIESRTFQLGEVCRWYRVPPHKIGDLSRSTFSNIEHQAIEFVQDCLLPWARRLESEADIKLFGRTSRGRRFTRLNLQSLLRGDSATQTANISTQVNTGLATINEGRELLDLPPVDGGDVTLVQGAMLPLEQVIEPPEAPEPPSTQPPMPPDTEPPDEPPGDGMDGMGDAVDSARRVFGALLTDTYSRLLRVEADKARRAANKGALSAHVESYYDRPEGAEHVQAALQPVFAGLLLALGRPAHEAIALAHAAAARHVHASRSCLLRQGAGALAALNGRAAGAAARDLEEVLACSRSA